MFLRLATLFIVVPIVELALLIELGNRIDLFPTIGIILATGFLGAFLTKLQGRAALAAIRAQLDRGELPGAELLDGLLILIAGVVLITPGLLTDVTGILLLVPPVRKVIRTALVKRYKEQLRLKTVRVGPLGGGLGGGFGHTGDVIDITPEPPANTDLSHR